MIIHTPHTMTIRQYSLYETDRNPAHLYRRFKWLARFGLFVDDIQQFITDFNKLFNPESGNDLYRQVEKLQYQNKLVIMQALAEGIHLHLVTRMEMKISCERIGMKLPEDKQLLKYLEEIKQVAGIEVHNLDDIQAFKDVWDNAIKEAITKKMADDNGRNPESREQKKSEPLKTQLEAAKKAGNLVDVMRIKNLIYEEEQSKK